MADRYLKHVPSGQIFIYAPPFVAHEDFVEVADAQGNPIVLEAEVSPAPKRAKKAAIEAPAEVPATDDSALSADASRGL